MRIGWIAAHPEIRNKCVLLKQGVDLCTTLKAQMEISRFIDQYDFETRIQKIVSVYRQRRNAMLQAAILIGLLGDSIDGSVEVADLEGHIADPELVGHRRR